MGKISCGRKILIGGGLSVSIIVVVLLLTAERTMPGPNPAPEVSCQLGSSDSKEKGEVGVGDVELWNAVTRGDNSPAFTCLPPNCGGNSPLVNAFPVNGLNGRVACRNLDGDYLKPQVILANEQPHAEWHLDYVRIDDIKLYGEGFVGGYELAVVDDKGSIQRRGNQLIEMEFLVADKHHELRSYKIGHVASIHVTTFESSTECAPDSVTQGTECVKRRVSKRMDKRRVVYLISRTGKSHSVCISPPPGEPDAEEARIAMVTPAHDSHNEEQKQSLSGVLDEDVPLYAMVVPEAVYSPGGKLVKGSFSREPTGWFNLACDGDALAQTEILGLSHAPGRKPSNDMEAATMRLPALQMLTAKYYGGRSATTRGTPIAWRWQDQSAEATVVGTSTEESHGNPAEQDRTLEAIWENDGKDGGGARCVKSSRLWRTNKIIYIPDQLKRLFDRDSENQNISEDSFLDKIYFDSQQGNQQGFGVNKRHTSCNEESDPCEMCVKKYLRKNRHTSGPGECVDECKDLRSYSLDHASKDSNGNVNATSVLP